MQTRKIRVMIPDLPSAEDLLPWLQRIDAARWYTNFGPLVQELEACLARDWPVPSQQANPLPLHVVTLNNGTTALELGIMAQNLPAGGMVLQPAYTFAATASAVLRNNLVPLFADVALDNWQLTPAIARAAAQRYPLAMVMPVATFGCPVDTAAWDAFVDDTGIPVLIDAAAGFGNQAVGQRAATSFSLHATKPFGIGEGGLFVTRDAGLAKRVRRLANFGFENCRVTQPGTNGKLSEYGAAVALAQWQRWPALQATRRALWVPYRSLLTACSTACSGSMPQSEFAQASVQNPLPAPLVLRLPVPAAAVLAQLAEAGIESRRWYCPPLHHSPAFASCPVAASDGEALLPVTELLGSHTLGIPWHTRLTQTDMEHVARHLQHSLERL